MELDEFIELVKEQQGIDLSGVLTTADKIDRPERALEKQAIIDFENRNPMAGGGRINFYKGMSAKKAPQKFKLEKEKTSSGFAGDRKLTQDQINALDPDYLGKINIEDAENKSREKNVKVYNVLLALEVPRQQNKFLLCVAEVLLNLSIKHHYPSICL